MAASGKVDLKNICNVLGSIKHKWFEIGIQLGIDRNKLLEFKKEDDPLSATVDFWLKGNTLSSDVPISWKSIVEVLRSEHVGEPALANQVSLEHGLQDGTKIQAAGGESPVTESQSSSSTNPQAKLDPEVEMDLKFILEKNLKNIIKKYASYVDCLRSIVEEKGVEPKALCSYLLSLSAFSSSSDGKRLALMSDKEAELQKAETVTDIFTFLTTKCASFLNFDIFQSILEKYNISEDRKELKYREHLEEYIEKHKISEFVSVNPLLKSKLGSKKMTLKYNVEYTCKLAKVFELKNSIAEILELNPSALHIIDVEDGCVIVTFLIPSPIADFIFTSDTVFTQNQEDQLRAASVLWLKCNGYSFHFGRGEVKSKEPSEIPALKKLKDQLACPICLGTYTNPKQLNCFHVYCQNCLERLVEQNQHGQHILTCPNCRQVTNIPINGVAGLQSAFHVNQLLELVNEDWQEVPTALTKRAIKDNPAEESIPLATHLPMKNISLCCSVHDGREVELYCETCEEAICYKCTKRNEKHNSHNYEDLDEVFEKYKGEIPSSLEVIEKALTDLDASSDKISNQQKVTEEDINGAISQLHEILDDRKKALVNQLNQLTQAKLKDLAAQRDQLEIIQVQLSKHWRRHEDWEKLDQASIQDKVLVAKNVSMPIRQLKDLSIPKEASIAFAASENVIEACQNYGHIFDFTDLGLPVILQEPPRAITVVEGEELRLCVQAYHTEPLSYQWFHGENAVQYGTSNALLYFKASLMEGGIYKCYVSSGYGSIYTNSTNVTVLPSITEEGGQGEAKAPRPFHEPYSNLWSSHEDNQFIHHSNVGVLPSITEEGGGQEEARATLHEPYSNLWPPQDMGGHVSLNSSFYHPIMPYQDMHFAVVASNDKDLHTGYFPSLEPAELTPSLNFAQQPKDPDDLGLPQGQDETADLDDMCYDKVALLIGNKQYLLSVLRLNTPENDVQDLALVLRSADFKVLSLVNLNKNEMENALKYFEALLGKNVYALFFFAGQGFEQNGKNYMMPVDSDVEKNPEQCICAQNVLQDMQAKGTKLSIMLLDMCRVNASYSYSITPDLYHSTIPGSKGYFLTGFACSSMEKAYELGVELKEPVEGYHSIFVSALIKHLNSGNLDERVDTLFRDAAAGVRKQGQEYTLNSIAWQKPEIHHNLGEKLSLADPIKVDLQCIVQQKERALHWQEAHRVPDREVVSSVGGDVALRLHYEAEHSNVLIVTAELLNGSLMSCEVLAMEMSLCCEVMGVNMILRCSEDNKQYIYGDKQCSYGHFEGAKEKDLMHFKIYDLQKIKTPSVTLKITVSYSIERHGNIKEQKNSEIVHEMIPPLYGKIASKMHGTFSTPHSFV